MLISDTVEWMKEKRNWGLLVRNFFDLGSERWRVLKRCFILVSLNGSLSFFFDLVINKKAIAFDI